jgi:hypothetical protein
MHTSRAGELEADKRARRGVLSTKSSLLCCVRTTSLLIHALSARWRPRYFAYASTSAALPSDRTYCSARASQKQHHKPLERHTPSACARLTRTCSNFVVSLPSPLSMRADAVGDKFQAPSNSLRVDSPAAPSAPPPPTSFPATCLLGRGAPGVTQPSGKAASLFVAACATPAGLPLTLSQEQECALAGDLHGSRHRGEACACVCIGGPSAMGARKCLTGATSAQREDPQALERNKRGVVALMPGQSQGGV